MEDSNIFKNHLEWPFLNPCTSYPIICGMTKFDRVKVYIGMIMWIKSVKPFIMRVEIIHQLFRDIFTILQNRSE